MNNNLYIVTGVGPCIDTICAVFETRQQAYEWLEKEWKELGEHSLEEIASNIWKTEDSYNQNIEWEIHSKSIHTLDTAN